MDTDAVNLPLHISELGEVAGGTFFMGAADNDLNAHPNEKPLHNPNVTTFYLARYPVTNEAYRQFVAATKHPPPAHWRHGEPTPDTLKHPVVNVSHADACAYCAWLTEQTGHLFRLPSEPEWEKAARGAIDHRIYPWGSEWANFRCNAAESGHNQTTPVTDYETKQENEYGLVDMAGNVWEWTDTWFEKYPGSRHKSTHFGQTHRVVRGGSFKNDRYACRVSQRGRYKPDTRRPYLGFRIASDRMFVPKGDALAVERKTQSNQIGNKDLRQKIYDCFNTVELKILIEDLGLRADDFPGTLKERVHELITASHRHGFHQKLLTFLRERRPHVNWDEE